MGKSVEAGPAFSQAGSGSTSHTIGSLQVLSARAIQTAVRLKFTGELAKHAVSEGTKALTKFTSNSSKTNDSRSNRSSQAGLQFLVEGTAALAAKLQPGVVLSEGAACYLSAVLEYMVAELMELSGNAAGDERMDTISSRHILRALQNDDELNDMTTHATIARAGWMPNIDDRLTEMANDIAPSAATTGFDELFVEKIKGAQAKTLIDPRDGRHYRLISDDCDAISAGKHVEPVPELDLVSEFAAEARRLQALYLMTDSEKAVFDADACDPGRQLKHSLRQIQWAQADTTTTCAINQCLF